MVLTSQRNYPTYSRSWHVRYLFWWASSELRPSLLDDLGAWLKTNQNGGEARMKLWTGSYAWNMYSQMKMLHLTCNSVQSFKYVLLIFYTISFRKTYVAHMSTFAVLWRLKRNIRSVRYIKRRKISCWKMRVSLVCEKKVKKK